MGTQKGIRPIIESRLGYQLSKYKRVDYVINEGSPFVDFNDPTKWVNTKPADGTVTSIETNTLTGKKTLKLSVTTSGAYVQADMDVSMKFATPPNFIIPMYLYDSLNDYDYFELQLKRDTEVLSSHYFSASSHELFANLPKKQWTFFHAASWYQSGIINWNNINQIRVRLKAKTDKTCSVLLDGIRMGMEFEPKIIFRFDDGLSGVYEEAFSIMETAGIKGTVYLIPSKIEESAAGYMSLVQCQALYEAGWDCGNHSYNHVNFNEEDYAETLDEVKLAQDWLIEKGFYRSARHFCVPYGADTDYLQHALRDVGVLTSTNSRHAYLPPLMIDPYKIPAEAIYDDTSVAKITGWIDSAVAKGNTLVLMLHNIKDEPGNQYEYSTENFQAVVDHIVNNNLEKYVVTMSEWYKGLNRG
jgi:peptidoglycan/xylan/chitin deacetylase (PgdA/CDA1 family)